MSSNLVSEQLRVARAKINTPDKWTPYWGRDGRRCAMQALGTTVGEGYSILHELAGGHGVSTFNDSHTHAEVMALFDAAIAEAERRGI